MAKGEEKMNTKITIAMVALVIGAGGIMFLVGLETQPEDDRGDRRRFG